MSEDNQHFNINILISILKEDLTEFKKIIPIDLKSFDCFSELLCLISNEINLRITSSKYEIKIKYEDDWVNLIDLKSFYFFLSNDYNLKNQTQLLIRNKKYDLNEVDFNLNGDKFENEKQILSNRPNMKIYNSKESMSIILIN